MGLLDGGPWDGASWSDARGHRLLTDDGDRDPPVAPVLYTEETETSAGRHGERSSDGYAPSASAGRGRPKR